MAGSFDKKKAIRIGILFAAGLIAGWFGASLIGSLRVRLSLADVIGLFMAVMLVGSGLLVLFAGTNRRTYAQLSGDAEPGEVPDGGMLRFARRQGITNALAGVAFAAPPLAMAFGAPDTLRAPIFVAIVLVVLVESWINYRLWRDGDELVRSVVTRSGALCFWLLQGLFFLWAAAERMALVGGVDSWTLLVVLMGTYLLVGSWVSVKSGLATQ